MPLSCVVRIISGELVDFTFDNRQGNGKVSLLRVSQVNVILGRNGSGKSRFLRFLDEKMADNPAYRVRYVTPERAGSFQREGGVETSMSSNPGWAPAVRRVNQLTSFKHMSHVHLRNAETAYLRNLQNTDARGRSFQVDCLDPISRLLSNVSIEQGDPDFVFRSTDGTTVKADALSSGESEAIALASEILNFFRTVDPTKLNVLLMDEPDVHQHPDLQGRLAQYLLSQYATLSMADQERVIICLATHSSPLVFALAGIDLVSVGTKDFDSDTVEMSPLSEHIKKIAPFFGHPLSLSLSGDPMLILEGDDDERVWQQAARSSNGRIRIFPVLAQSVSQQTALEKFSGPLLTALYDKPLAYSIRDGDGKKGGLAPEGPVIRFRLECYAIENTLVTTEALATLGLDWAGFQAKATAWMAAHPTHQDIDSIRQLLASPDRSRHSKIKDIRQLIIAIADLTKPWEVVVGQSLAATIGTPSAPADAFGLLAFVGAEASKRLLHAT